MNGLQTEESGKKSFSFKPFLITLRAIPNTNKLRTIFKLVYTCGANFFNTCKPTKPTKEIIASRL